MSFGLQRIPNRHEEVPIRIPERRENVSGSHANGLDLKLKLRRRGKFFKRFECPDNHTRPLPQTRIPRLSGSGASHQMRDRRLAESSTGLAY